LFTVKVIELTLVLTLMVTVHWPDASLCVQEAVARAVQTPLTTAPDRAGSIVATTVAFQKFLLIVELLPARDATVTVWFAIGPTVTVIEALPVRPPESVTEAVMVCVPSLSTALKEPPVPIWPSRLEVQTRLLVRLPSSVSVAEPEKLMEVPEAKLAPSAGLVMLTVGAVLLPPPPLPGTNTGLKECIAHIQQRFLDAIARVVRPVGIAGILDLVVQVVYIRGIARLVPRWPIAPGRRRRAGWPWRCR
jgi:hypothetical protein